MFWIYIALLFQSFMYALVYNYLGCVYPGPGGLKRPLFFFLDVSDRLCLFLNYLAFRALFVLF